jgi:hypothetical protein
LNLLAAVHFAKIFAMVNTVKQVGQLQLLLNDAYAARLRSSIESCASAQFPKAQLKLAVDVFLDRFASLAEAVWLTSEWPIIQMTDCLERGPDGLVQRFCEMECLTWRCASVEPCQAWDWRFESLNDFIKRHGTQNVVHWQTHDCAPTAAEVQDWFRAFFEPRGIATT